MNHCYICKKQILEPDWPEQIAHRTCKVTSKADGEFRAWMKGMAYTLRAGDASEVQSIFGRLLDETKKLQRENEELLHQYKSLRERLDSGEPWVELQQVEKPQVGRQVAGQWKQVHYLVKKSETDSWGWPLDIP